MARWRNLFKRRPVKPKQLHPNAVAAQWWNRNRMNVHFGHGPTRPKKPDA